MSGGYFNYIQDRFDEPIEKLKDVIDSNERGYSQETIDVFIDTLMYLKLSRVFLQRVDWLLSDDDSEETFRERLAEDLAGLR
jgi:predicted esterase YcpF (UPF0227 family)